ncbi:hypothetical protein A7U60_g8143 [Sanghuangporus baumii]|uniref:Rhodanese domain-containing protein n=1 Tax=Sanghuangporus baumii TaxID=108892 RepID=A0A9Q5HS46_SANBA|nr:hypothetical protein A7U60_g8143 [Sanghuangporus baumii]
MASSLALSSLSDYRRYGRQMIIDGLGLPAQVKLQDSSVLVVGAGGLGCPALQYLCSTGVGRIGIVDHDIVELSNLQRQVLHSEETLGMPKVESAAQALKKLNSTVRTDTYKEALNPSNAEHILSKYSVILDCTDNAPVRYLLSDTCVRLGLPLVSGAAQRLDGQLCVYNLPLETDRTEERGPCYRCLFPTPPAPEMQGSCEEMGILGAVTGVIGSLQALEAIKVICGLHDHKPSLLIYSALAFPPFRSVKLRSRRKNYHKPSLLIYSALAFPPFRSVKLRSRRKNCPACGEEGERIGKISELDYVAFCGGPRPDWVERGLVTDGSRRRISANELSKRLRNDNNSVRIVDVRSPVEFGICHLPGSQNVPLSELVASPLLTSKAGPVLNHSVDKKPLTVFVCRLGNDSQIAADAFRDSGDAEVADLIGGLRSWAADVDPGFPVY